MARHYVTADVEVDVTDKVESLAIDRAKELVRTAPLGLGAAALDLDTAILGVRRLSRRGRATDRAVLDLLLDLLGADALRRAVGEARRCEP